MIEKLPLLLDCDGVLFDFETPVLNFINSKNNTSFDVNDIGGDIRDALKDYWTKDVEDFIRSPGFAYNLKLYPGAEEFVWGLQKYLKVMFVTSPYYSSPTWVYDRLNSLKDRFRDASYHNVIFAKDKRYILGKYFVDDNSKNVINWSRQNEKGIPILFKRQWNKNDVIPKDVEYRIVKTDSYEEILNLVRGPVK